MLVYYKMNYIELLDKISSLRMYVQNLIDSSESDQPMLDTIIEVVQQLEHDLKGSQQIYEGRLPSTFDRLDRQQ